MVTTWGPDTGADLARPHRCKRCRRRFRGDLPDWQVLMLCDLCADEMVVYVIDGHGNRNVRHRVAAVRRLYHRAEYPPGVIPIPDRCESGP